MAFVSKRLRFGQPSHNEETLFIHCFIIVTETRFRFRFSQKRRFPLSER
jgi:hypothetical protein